MFPTSPVEVFTLQRMGLLTDTQVAREKASSFTNYRGL